MKHASDMNEQREIDPATWVRDVIIDLLLTTLPPELQAAAPELADRVGQHPSVRPHFGKRWGDLTEGQGNIVARETGVVARAIESGAGYVSPSGGEHLH
jgi:hypothetical protein